MRRIVDNDLITIIARIVVGVTFIYASFYKIIEPGDFARSIWYYHMLPGNLINLMALILPWVELVCGLCIIIGVFYRGTVILLNLMMIMFIVALSSAIVRGINIDCGCFKAAQASSESALRALWIDLVLIILTVQLFFSRSRKWMLSAR